MISGRINLAAMNCTKANGERSVITEWKTNGSTDFSLSDLKGLDYGTGMAYSYYYGYLRLILPSTGTTSKGYIPPDLREASNQWMESAQELEEERRNRAGIIGRIYRNNVYKIYSNGRESGANPVYVAVEGATPLLTFYEIQVS